MWALIFLRRKKPILQILAFSVTWNSPLLLCDIDQMEGGNHSIFVHVKQQSWWHSYYSLSNCKVCNLWAWACIRGLHVDGLSLSVWVHCNQQSLGGTEPWQVLNLRDLQGRFLWILMLFSLHPFVLPSIEQGGLVFSLFPCVYHKLLCFISAAFGGAMGPCHAGSKRRKTC